MEDNKEEFFKLGILNQDNEVLKVFYIQNFKIVKSWVIKNGGKLSDAEDVFQDAVIALYLNLKKDKYQSQENKGISAYFLQICKFRWYDLLKKKANQELSLDEVSKEPIQDMLPIDIVDKHYKLHTILNELKEKCKTIIRYFYWDKMDLKSIADILKMEVESVKNAKYRCLQKLRERIANEKDFLE